MASWVPWQAEGVVSSRWWRSRDALSDRSVEERPREAARQVEVLREEADRILAQLRDAERGCRAVRDLTGDGGRGPRWP